MFKSQGVVLDGSGIKWVDVCLSELSLDNRGWFISLLSLISSEQANGREIITCVELFDKSTQSVFEEKSKICMYVYGMRANPYNPQFRKFRIF